MSDSRTIPLCVPCLDRADRSAILLAIAIAIVPIPRSAHAQSFVDSQPLADNAASDTGADTAPHVANDRQGNWVAVWQSTDSLVGTIGSDEDILFSRSSDDGQTWSSPGALNTNAASDSGADIAPRLTTNGNGVWVAVWQSVDTVGDTIGTDPDILFARSIDAGATWSAPAPLNSNAIANSVDDLTPDVLADRNGDWIAVWSSRDSIGGSVGSDRDIVFSRSTDAAITWSPLAALTPHASVDSHNDDAPRLAADGWRNWIVGWESRDTLGGTIGNDVDILVASSQDAGLSWSNPVVPNAAAFYDSTNDRGVSIDADSNGNWVMGWSTRFYSGADPDLIAATSNDIGATWSVVALNDNAGTDMGFDQRPDIRTDGAGNWLAIWPTHETLGGTLGLDYDVFYVTSTDAGATWTSPLPLVSSAASDSGHDIRVALATDSLGRWVAIWDSIDSIAGTIGDDEDILFATAWGPDTDGDGLFDGAEARLHFTNPSLADSDADGLNDGHEVAIYQSDPLHPYTDGDSFSDFEEAIEGSDPTNPFSGPLNLLQFGDIAPLNTSAAVDAGDDSSPRLAMDQANTAIAVWSSTDTLAGAIGDDADILVSRSLDWGVSWSAPVVLNSNAFNDSGDDVAPQISTDGMGNWMVVWESDDTLGGALGSDLDLLVARSMDGGVSWTPPAAPDPNAGLDTADDRNASISTDMAGTWVIVSSSGLAGIQDFEILSATSIDAGASWRVQLVNSGAGSDTGDDLAPQIDTDLAGNWLVVWETDDPQSGTLGDDFDVLVSTSTDPWDGSWGNATAVNDRAAIDSGDDRGAQIRCDRSGLWVAVWESSDPLGGTIGEDIDLLTSSSSDAGLSWTPAIPLNRHAGIDDVDDVDVQIMTDGAQNWIAAWRSDFSQGGVLGADSDILVARSRTPAVKWLAATALSGDAVADSGVDSRPSIATNGIGNWLAAWQSDDTLGASLGSDLDILFAHAWGPDFDFDDLSDGAEVNLHGTSLFDFDSDYDGIDDGNEINLYGTDPNDVDSDNDGLSDGAEVTIYSSDPALSDSDADGFDDAAETTAGANPSDPGETPLETVSFGASGILNINAASDTGHDSLQRIATDGSGNWIAVWHSDENLGGILGPDADIFVSTSVDAGRTWSAPTALNGNAETDSGDDFLPEIACDGSGNWLVVWISHDGLAGTLGSDGDVLFSRSSDFGVTWSSPGPVHANASLDSGEDLRPQIATDETGTWVVVWESYDDLGGTIGTDTDILSVRSTDAGDNWSPPSVLNTNAAGDSGTDESPQLASDDANGWMVVWSSRDSLTDTIGVDSDILVARSIDAAVSWSPPIAVNDNAAGDSGDDVAPDVATDGNGLWAVIWQSRDTLGQTIGQDFDVFVSRSNDIGATWSVLGVVNSNASIDLGNDVSPQIATTNDGEWLAIWISDDPIGGTIGWDTDILAARSLDGALSWTALAPLNPSATSDVGFDAFPQITTDDLGNWLAVWNSWDSIEGLIGNDGDIRFAVGLSSDSDADGVSNESEAQVHGTDAFDDDSDDDGVADGTEIWAPGLGSTGLFDPLDVDSDGDGILDGTELGLTQPEGNDTDLGVFVPDADPNTTTDPLLADSDADGLADGMEDVNKNGRVDPGEIDPNLFDTDGDGHSDGAEVAAGSDPTDAESVPVYLVPAFAPLGLFALSSCLVLLGARRLRVTGR